jgi:cytochrome b
MADQRAASASTSPTTEIRVWDPLVRISHWTMAIGFVVAYFSEDALALHVWAGYVVGVVILLRIVWGFVGPQHARFSDFLYRPSEVATYLGDLLRFRGKRYLGHSPAGGVMAVVLLAGIAATVGTGLVVYALEENAGLLAGLMGSTAGSSELVGEDEEGEDESEGDREGSGELWEEIHEVLANVMLALVIAHILGVLLASRVHRENLVRAMITGNKRAPSA